MNRFLLACLVLAAAASPAQASIATINVFNNNTAATVTFDDGAGHSGTVNTLLTQYNVTYSTSGGTPVTFLTFSIDLFHTVTSGQSYAVNARNDLATAYTNGSRISYIFQNFGLQDLTANSIQAAAVQISLWDLSLNNHNPTFFAADGGGNYSSGDALFRVSFGSNPDASQIASLTNQYLIASIGATTQGSWLDAAAAGNDPGRGQSLVQPVPEPPSIFATLIGLGCLSVPRWRRFIATVWRTQRPD